jgi:ubiquinone/menaquinone biosynthesis C-methylase UbiE
MTQRQPPRQQFAGSIAENYHRHLVPAIFEPWAEDLVDFAAPRPGERVLDVACGPGSWPAWPPAVPARAR